MSAPPSPTRSSSPSSPVVSFVNGRRKGAKKSVKLSSAPLPPKKREVCAVHGPSFSPVVQALVSSSEVTGALFQEGADAFRRLNEGGSTEANEWMTTFCESFFNICQEFGLGSALAKELGTQEIRKTTEASLLFRHDSPATKIFRCCNDALSQRVFKCLTDIFLPKVEETLSVLDYDALTSSSPSAEKTEAENITLAAITDIVSKISAISRKFFPAEVRNISMVLANEAEKCFGREGKRSFCVGFFFLRNIVSTLTISAVDLVKRDHSLPPSFQKYCVLMTKIMQKAVLGETMEGHFEVINKGLPELNSNLEDMVCALVGDVEDDDDDVDNIEDVDDDEEDIDEESEEERVVNFGAMPIIGTGDLKFISQEAIDFVAHFLHQNGGNIRKLLKGKREEDLEISEKNLEILTSFQIHLERYKSQFKKEPLEKEEEKVKEEGSPKPKRRFSISKKAGKGSKSEETSKYISPFGAGPGPSPLGSPMGASGAPPRTSDVFRGYSDNPFSFAGPHSRENSLGLEEDFGGKRKLAVPVQGSKRAHDLMGEERSIRGGSESTFLKAHPNSIGNCGVYGGEAAGFGGFGSGGGEKIVLGEVLEDDRVRAAFLSFLSRNYMAEGLLLWLELQKLRMCMDEKDWCVMFLSTCEEFLLPDSPEHCHVQGCMDDIVAAYHVLKRLSTLTSLSCSPPASPPMSSSFSSSSCLGEDDVVELPLTPSSLQPLILKIEKVVWGNMAASCLPLFILSFEYKAFMEGKVDTAKAAFSREKAERFFGERIEGPLLQRMLIKNKPKSRLFGRK